MRSIPCRSIESTLSRANLWTWVHAGVVWDPLSWKRWGCPAVGESKQTDQRVIERKRRWAKKERTKGKPQSKINPRLNVCWCRVGKKKRKEKVAYFLTTSFSTYAPFSVISARILEYNMTGTDRQRQRQTEGEKRKSQLRERENYYSKKYSTSKLLRILHREAHVLK